MESLPLACGGAGGTVGAVVTAALHFFAASQCLVKEPWPANATISNGSSFDFVVVGGGSAGAALSARLARRHRVLLLEAGADPPPESIIPGFKDVLMGGPYDWKFLTANDGRASQALAGGRQRQPRGKMLGGSGSLNSMVYSRGFPADYADWARVAGDAWSWDNVLQYFKKTEHMTDVNIVDNMELMKYHGRGGDIEVTGFNETSFAIDRFLEAFKEIGFDVVDDMTYPHRIGAGRLSHTVSDGKRHSSLTAMLDKVSGDNIFVLKNALVSKVIIENNTAIGVEALIGGEVYNFYANKEVILTAGTFNTAKILMLSGIGPKDHLEEFGIDVVKDLPVGSNLHDHVMYLNYFAAEKGTCNTSEAFQHMNTVKYLYDRSGTLSRADSMGALLVLNGSQPNTPDFAFYPTCIPIGVGFYQGCTTVIGFKPATCAQIDALNQKYELLSVAVVLLKPKSRGKVRLASTDPYEDPVIYSGTFDNCKDLDGFPEAVKVIHNLAKTKYMKEKSARLIDFKLDECIDLEGDEEVKCEVMNMGTSAWHAVGSAALGRVLDGQLRVRGMRALRVADASAMPSIVRGNPNAPVVMIAEKAADFIKARYGAE